MYIAKRRLSIDGRKRRLVVIEQQRKKGYHLCIKNYVWEENTWQIKRKSKHWRIRGKRKNTAGSTKKNSGRCAKKIK